MAETALLGKGPESTEEFGDGENKDNNVRTSTADYTRNKTAAKTLGAEGAQSIKGSSACMIRVTQTKGVDVAATVLEGARFDGKQPVSKMTTRLTQFYEEFNTYNEIHDSFVEMGLRENLLKGIYAYGLAMPSAIHRRGIVPFCKGLDVIQQSLSGTTVTLACGVLQRLDYGSTECQALVLVPTRDLAQETEKVIGALGQWLGVKAHACLGGTSIREEKQISSSSNQVIVATPGRALNMLTRRALCPDNIRMFVLDEADEILAGGLKNQIYDIIQLLPAKILFAVFSTAMSNEALELCRKCMNKPMKVIVPKDEELEGFSVKQFYVKAENEESKFQKLCDLFDTMAVMQNIIFVNARRKVKPLTEKIRGRGYTVSASHGGMDQHSRDAAVQDLQSGSSRVLVTTDLHGADALQVPVVINYDLPAQPVQYLRNVRRSGHPGGIGVAISFVARADERVLSGIQRFCNTQMAELPSNVADLL
ncbi:eukaryotic initiation factor 4A-like [Triticum aestivum]|nr:eukaryotic initiation factor 4A-like [Triticum aestivum]